MLHRSLAFGGVLASAALLRTTATQALTTATADVPTAAATAAAFTKLPIAATAATAVTNVPAAASTANSISPSPHVAAAATLRSYAARWAALRAYSTTVTLFERKGENVDRRVLDYRFEKPGHVVIRVISGPHAGSILTWDGGPALTAQLGSGLLGAFKRRLALHDATAVTVRGSSIDELGYGAILTRLETNLHDVTEDAPARIDGEPVWTLVLTPADPALNDGFTREVISLSQKTLVPVRITGFEAQTLVCRLDFHNTVIE